MKDEKKPVEHQCEFCKKTFVKESSLINHSCVKKTRWLQRDHKHNILGFDSWLYFYKSCGLSGKKEKTYYDFINSSYFSDFVKFGKFVQENNIKHYERYLDYLIKNSIKLKDWATEKEYNKYKRQCISREKPFAGIERSIEHLLKWSQEYNKKPTDYYECASGNRIVHDILSGNISPWLIYISKNSNKIFDKLDDHQLSLIEETINPLVWRIKIRRFEKEVDELSEMLNKEGI